MHKGLGFLLILAGSLGIQDARAVTVMRCPSVQPVPFSQIYVGALSGLMHLPEDKDPKFRKKAPPLSCGDIEEVAQVILSVNRMVGHYLPTPRSVELDFVRMEGNAFAAGASLLHLPREVIFEELAKNPIFTRPVWAHEYGHAVFLFGLVEREPKMAVLRDVYDRYIKLSLVMADLQDHRTRLANQDLKGCADEACRIRVQAEIDALGSRIAATDAERNAVENSMPLELRVLHELASPYNELFADAVAVALTGRPNAVKDAIFRTRTWQKEGPEGNCYSCRDFSARENSLQQWVAWRARLKQRGESTDLMPNSSHNLLAPARYHLWNRYMRNGWGRLQPGLFLSKVLDAIFETLNQPASGSSIADPVWVNQQFIDILDRNLLFPKN